MNQKLYLILAIFACITFSTTAQNNKPIFPSPQKIKYSEGKISSDVPYLLQGNLKLQPNSLAVLNELFNTKSANKALPVIITSLKSADKNLTVSGAYTLKTTPQSIQISVSDNRGAFYALQTLKQLKTDNNFPLVDITDFPDVLSRGSVEGFYGNPWSHQDRISQFKFYGGLKLNTYIYGPKDDPYHSSPNWRKPYPEKDAQQIKELVQEAKNNEIDFG